MVRVVHVVVVLAMDGVVPFDLAVPLEVFGRARLPGGAPAYRVLTAAPAEEVAAGPLRIRAPYGLDALRGADTVVVPGVADASAAAPRPVVEALRAAGAAGARVAALSTGAFTLAAAGLLDGRRATTHWAVADDLARRFPAVVVDPSVLHVDEGPVVTSAGSAAGLDTCLHLVRRDHGAEVAADAAARTVMPPEREGGQPQVTVHEPPGPRRTSVQPLLRWLQDNCEQDLDLAGIAAHVGVSPRTLTRRFHEQIGLTPVQWLHRARLRRAQQLLETTDDPVEHIGARVGFSSSTTFREGFRRVVGTSPQGYRRAHRAHRARRGREERVAGPEV